MPVNIEGFTLSYLSTTARMDRCSCKKPAASAARDGGRSEGEIVFVSAGAVPLLLGRAIDEAADVGFQFGEIFIAEIHHVSRIVILQADILLKFVRQAEMLHGVLSSVERRCQIIESIFHFDLKMLVGEHGLNEIAFHVWRPGESEVVTAAAMLPIPTIACLVGTGAIDLVLPVL